MSKDEVLNIYKRESEKRNQVMKENKTESGITYYTCGELNVHNLVKTALSLIG